MDSPAPRRQRVAQQRSRVPMAGSGQEWEVPQARSCEQEQRRRDVPCPHKAAPIVTSLSLLVSGPQGHVIYMRSHLIDWLKHL